MYVFFNTKLFQETEHFPNVPCHNPQRVCYFVVDVVIANDFLFLKKSELMDRKQVNYSQLWEMYNKKIPDIHPFIQSIKIYRLPAMCKALNWCWTRWNIFHTKEDLDTNITPHTHPTVIYVIIYLSDQQLPIINSFKKIQTIFQIFAHSVVENKEKKKV